MPAERAPHPPITFPSAPAAPVDVRGRHARPLPEHPVPLHLVIDLWTSGE